MSKATIYINLILIVIIIILISWNIIDNNSNNFPIYIDNKKPTYRSQHTITLVYDSLGKLRYKLVALDVQYYSKNKISWFTQPLLTIYDKNIKQTWLIRADKAKITDNHMLYLYGGVEVNSLITITQLKKITTHKAQVNLLTQGISSNDTITLYGINFISRSVKLRGNLQEKTLKLIDKVHTYYDMQAKTKNI
ncbi:LPS export ABC transporter periplasmic protein LptC [Candidatus Profftia sp. (ex Adelges kitamiensis)]|uniref:LPS export ABC transporter periplasmic protein LptC n=1 Tax=Candidatus Profftia sp. (ex Adelges kitamiensis) TaxID=2864218 RepID=UPI001CE2C626|nr:LPS export ABC transporter periplasmic protein LptC [Candidatus Profftia sp. (ex Adelges kitamiensis)]